jgi:hypothetical protein
MTNNSRQILLCTLTGAACGYFLAEVTRDDRFAHAAVERPLLMAQAAKLRLIRTRHRKLSGRSQRQAILPLPRTTGNCGLFVSVHIPTMPSISPAGRRRSGHNRDIT